MRAKVILPIEVISGDATPCSVCPRVCLTEDVDKNVKEMKEMWLRDMRIEHLFYEIEHRHMDEYEKLFGHSLVTGTINITRGFPGFLQFVQKRKLMIIDAIARRVPNDGDVIWSGDAKQMPEVLKEMKLDYAGLYSREASNYELLNETIKDKDKLAMLADLFKSPFMVKTVDVMPGVTCDT